MHNLEKKFPAYFSSFELPKGAREESIVVYRACKTQKVDKKSFLPSFEENEFSYSPCLDDWKNPGVYSLSTYTDPKDVKRFATTNNTFRPPFKIAKGATEPCCGLVQPTKERSPKQKSSHVDWWLYENAVAFEHFTLIEDFSKYIEEYKKQKEILNHE